MLFEGKASRMESAIWPLERALLSSYMLSIVIVPLCKLAQTCAWNIFKLFLTWFVLIFCTYTTVLKHNNGNQINLNFSINSLLNPRTIVSITKLRKFQLETQSTHFSLVGIINQWGALPTNYPDPDPNSYVKDTRHLWYTVTLVISANTLLSHTIKVDSLCFLTII